jgi:hypothetical protein
VKTLGTPVRRTEPKTPPAAQAVASQEGGIPAAQAAERAGNARSTGARRSFRWQKSVERIARLARRKVARPGGGTSESLAGGKLEAPPDAEHEPRKGESVLRKSAHVKVRTRPVCEPRLAALRHDGRCSRALARLAFTGGAKQGPWLGGQPPSCAPQGECESGGSTSVGKEAGRVCLRVTTRASEARGGFGEGSTRTEKVRGGSASSDAEKAAVSGAPERMRPKLTTANSFVDSPLS